MVPINDVIISVQLLDMCDTYLQYNEVNLLSLEGHMDSYKCEDNIWSLKPPRWTNMLPKPYQIVTNASVNMDEACWIINESKLAMGEWERLYEAINAQGRLKTVKYMH